MLDYCLALKLERDKGSYSGLVLLISSNLEVIAFRSICSPILLLNFRLKG